MQTALEHAAAFPTVNCDLIRAVPWHDHVRLQDLWRNPEANWNGYATRCLMGQATAALDVEDEG